MCWLNPLLPEFIITATIMLNILIGAWQVKENFVLIRVGSIIALVVAAILFSQNLSINKSYIFNNMFVIDSFANLMKLIIVTVMILILVMHNGLVRRFGMLDKFEFPIMLLLATLGMLCVVSANNFIVLYMGIELTSLASYVLASFERNDIKSTEAGLKYFILGSLASGIFLYGVSLVYGFSGTVNFQHIAKIYANDAKPLALLIGMVMIIISLCFKIAAAPFHTWAPDVYQGSPTLVTLFFATAPKVAIMAVMSRFAAALLNGDEWRYIIVFISILSMMVGAIGAINQHNIKRLLAYSSIGHIGYALMGIAIGNSSAIQASVIYIILYIAANFGAFAFILSFNKEKKTFEDINEFEGVAQSNLGKALIFALVIGSMIGIPPLAGFLGKFYIFMAAIKAHLYLLVIVGAITTVISAYYYLKLLRIIFFGEAKDIGMAYCGPIEINITLALAAIIIVGFMLWPGLVIESSFFSSLALFIER